VGAGRDRQWKEKDEGPAWVGGGTPSLTFPLKGVGACLDKFRINQEEFYPFADALFYLRRAESSHHFEDLTLPADTEKRDHLF
jgi:hypothetical protein